VQKVGSIIVFCALLQFTAPTGAKAATIVDNSFETLSLTPGGFVNDPAGTGWIFDPNGASGIASAGSPWLSVTAPDGTQAAFLQSCQSQGWFSQTISDLTVGETYEITFWPLSGPTIRPKNLLSLWVTV
jgi:hypothetical protein